MRTGLSTKIRRAGGVVAILLGGHAVLMATPAAAIAGALTPEECASLVEEGQQARDDLAKLIEGANSGGGVTTTTTPEIASYVAELAASAAINPFGFVSADAGAPLDLCVPAGTTKITLFSDPIVLWEGVATTDAYPVTVEIPSGLECGAHRIQATGVAVDQSVEFTVSEGCAEVKGVTIVPGLPRTGAAVGGTVATAVGLIALGLAAVRARRSRLTAGRSV